MVAKRAYTYDEDNEYASITKPTANTDAFPQNTSLTKNQNPGSARLLEVRKKRLEEQKQANNDNRSPKAAVKLKYTHPLQKVLEKRAANKSSSNVAVDALQTSKASLVAMEEIFTFLPGYGIQFAAAVFYTLATYIADQSWFGFLVPIETLQFLSLAVLVIVTVFYATKAFLAFAVSGTNVYNTAVTISFPLCLLPIIPYLAFFPWLILWCGIVVWSQHK